MIVVAVLCAVVLAIGVGWLIGFRLGPSQDAADTIPTAAAPADLAAQACAYATETLPQQVADDVAADEVRAGLRRSRSLAQTAADRDPTWVALAGGMATLAKAVEADDPGATDLALRVVQAECR